jgi:hypothetical protein
MAVDKKEARNWLRKIRDVLNRDWDPIGGCPDDEYESYAGKIAAMIRDHATDEQLIAYLEWAEVEHMGLGLPFNQERAGKVVSAIRSLGMPGSD